jgi:hypothetical protein
MTLLLLGSREMLMFGNKHRAEKEAAEKARAEAELRAAVIELLTVATGAGGAMVSSPLVLKPAEQLVWGMRNGGLFEPRREPGHWSGRSAGVSVPVTDGIRLRIGKSAGRYVQGDEKPTAIDTGAISVTTERVVFQGSKYTREWVYSKLIGVMHYADEPWTAIQVSNREKTSGIIYTGQSPDPVRLRLAVAIAIFNGETDEVVKELREQLEALEAAAPESDASTPVASTAPRGTAHPVGAVATPPPVRAAAPPGAATSAGANPPMLSPPTWAGDPSGRHQLRYWDGRAWTDYVADDGRESRDPLPSA